MPPRAPNPLPLPAPPPGTVGLELSRWVVRACTADLGFALAGICHARPAEHQAHLHAWLAQGKHGQMHYLAEQLEARMDPARELPGTRSIIMVADAYAQRGQEPTQPTTTPTARIARYAQGRDYHDTLKRRLHTLADALRAALPTHHFRTFTDTAPVMERQHAQRAALGWTGKHTLLIHPRIGSYFLLGGILTTLDLPEPPDQSPTPDACGTCTRCIDACPTSAITAHTVDARKCISYLTIEHQTDIDPALHPAMGDWLFGCDICQHACPHNSPRPEQPPTPIHRAYAPRTASLPILELLNWTNADRAKTLGNSAIKRATLDMLKRNALIAAGNTLTLPRDQALFDRIKQIATDASEPAMLQQTARQVLSRIADVSPTEPLPPGQGQGWG